MTRPITSTILVLALAGTSSAAIAQSVAKQPDTNLGDIVVTARKKNESLLKVPVAVSAVTSDAILAKNITDLAGVAQNVPGFNVTNTGVAAGATGGSRADRGVQNISIRGIFNHTSVFIDGAPVNAGFVSGIDDLERVEIVKGPQSAYFGRNVFIGAINLVTKTPGNVWKGYVSGEYGSSALVDIRGGIQGPLIEDKLSFRLAVRDYSMDGQYANSGGPSARLGDQSTKSIDGAIVFTPTDNLKIKGYGLYWRDSDGPAAVGKFTSADWNCNAGGAPAGTLNYYCGTLPAFPASRLGQNTELDPLYLSTIINNSTKTLSPLYKPIIDHGGLERRAYHAHLNIDYQIPGSEITITSLSAINRDKVDVLSDIDNTNTFNLPNPNYGVRPNVEPYTNWLFYYQQPTSDRSEELRITSGQDSRFRWLAGANYTHTYTNVYVVQDNPVAGPIANQQGAPTKTNTVGGFFSLAYDITHRLTLNFEGRYQDDEIVQYMRILNLPPDGTSTQSVQASKHFRNFVPRVIAQYKLPGNRMIYATYSQGVSPGTFNEALLTATPVQLRALGALSAAGTTVKPEKLDNYELGFKGQFLDHKIQLTADVYYSVWKDQIVDQFVPLPSVDINDNLTGGTALTGVETNIGKTILKGVEAEILFAPTRHITFDFSGALNDSNIRDYNCQSPCVAITGSSNVKGNMLPGYSKWSGNASGNYDAPLTDTIDWFARLDYSYKSGMWDTFVNVAKTAARNLVDVHIGIKTKHYSLEGFVTNLLQDRGAVSLERNVDVLSPGFAGSALNVGMPTLRQFGVRGRYDF